MLPGSPRAQWLAVANAIVSVTVIATAQGDAVTKAFVTAIATV